MLLPSCFLTGFVRLPASAQPLHLDVARYAFGIRNNSYCNALMSRALIDSCAYEKYLRNDNLTPALSFPDKAP
ncbi:hypothetical protein [Prevotella falsenii]|uniref:hypothetical protein n=1 Tax=Prevotella falsenii TaxID=515414 RepID=UPI0012EC0C74|nr:hypothetical protein [Prevotella falsenii]